LELKKIKNITKKKRKVTNAMKKNILRKASLCIKIKDLTRGKYSIEKVYTQENIKYKDFRVKKIKTKLCNINLTRF
jgi:hypothetical protein